MPNNEIVSSRNLQSLLTNTHYSAYYELKQQILNEYPPVKHRTREQNLEVIRRVSDLMWDVNGPFQQFVFSQVSEIEQIKQEQRANPKKQGRKYVHKEDEY